MSTLAEIEAAADKLPPLDQQKLLLHLAERLHVGSHLPPPRKFSAQQIQAWVDEDVQDRREFEKRA